MESEPYFQEWVGENYEGERTLLLSESAYDWLDDLGDPCTPQPNHPSLSIEYNITHFGHARYFQLINQSLCRCVAPTEEAMRREWAKLAYSIYVQGSVGFGAGTRPCLDSWKEAGSHFHRLIEKLRPRKVILTGKDMWARMPECCCRLLDDIQAYRLADGSLVWCLALPHPANRIEGFSWERIGESIRWFRACDFPDRMAER